MGLSIKEQLLKAGVVSKKQVKKVEHDARMQSKKKKKGGGSSDNSAKARLQQQQAEQAQQDRKRNEERKQQAQLKADKAAAKQLIESNKLPLEEGNVAYHYFGGGKIKRILVNQDTADKLSKGLMGLARCNEDIVLVSADTVAKVLKRDKEAILVYNDPAEAEGDYPTDW